MDRHTALDRLELIRWDANDAQDPDFAEALAYLETDEQARETYARRNQQDRQIAESMRDVAVPEGFKSQLLAVLADTQATETTAVAEPPRAKLSRRRWILSAVTVMASCLLAALGVWWFQEPAPALLTLQELQSEAPFEESALAELEPFQGSFEPSLPGGLWMSPSQFSFSSPPKGLFPDRDGADRVAVHEFSFDNTGDRNRGKLRGVLLIVPKSALDSVPAYNSYFGTTYTTNPTHPHVAIRTWTEDDWVYISMVPIEHDAALNEALRSIGT